MDAGLQNSALHAGGSAFSGNVGTINGNVNHNYGPSADISIGQWILNWLSHNLQQQSQLHISEIYACSLLSTGNGYPLYCPEPFGIIAQHECAGVRVGDVGYVKPANGSFEALFNVCAEANDPMQKFGVPEGFELLDVGEGHFHIQDMQRRDNVIHSRRSHISSRASAHNLLAGAHGNIRRIRWNASEGAVVHLPSGAKCIEILCRPQARDAAIKHGRSWYNFVKRQRDIPYGLYFVTSCDKSGGAWMLGAFSGASSQQGVSLDISEAGEQSYVYSWSYPHVHEDKIGPSMRPREDIRPISRQEGAQVSRPPTITPASSSISPAHRSAPDGRNQCMFIKGFVITVRQETGKPLINGIEKLEDSDIRRSGKKRSNFWSRFWGSTEDSNGGDYDEKSDQPSSSQTSSRGGKHNENTFSPSDVQVDFFPGESMNIHPSILLNKLLLEMVPEADVAVTHDDDWLILLGAGPSFNIEKLRAHVGLQNGGAYFDFPKDWYRSARPSATHSGESSQTSPPIAGVSGNRMAWMSKETMNTSSKASLLSTPLTRVASAPSLSSKHTAVGFMLPRNKIRKPLLHTFVNLDVRRNRPTFQDTDPLDTMLQPPPGETEKERAIRNTKELRAKQVSQDIDAQIATERSIRKGRAVKLLLLGQSESGKSTALRQFQRLYTPTTFREEKIFWRSVIQLNIVHSIRTILEALSAHYQSTQNDTLNRTSSWSSSDLEILKARLSPLQHVESLLTAKFVTQNGPKAISSTSDSDWQKQAFVQSRFDRNNASEKTRLVNINTKDRHLISTGITEPETDDKPQILLHLCRQAMRQLWEDNSVKEVLKQHKIRLEESPGFFLNDLERITSLEYVPTDSDVLRARLKTVGASQYKFKAEPLAGRITNTEWSIVDVGGSQSQRPTWAPFFDDLDAIIFVAPLSVFDQALDEKSSVNRLEDSLSLWKCICQNKLLAQVELVLFLNKCDILEAKLRSGVQVSQYIKGYGERVNDLENVVNYFKGNFGAIQREYSPQPRKLHAFATSLTDTANMEGIITSLSDMVVRTNLQRATLM